MGCAKISAGRVNAWIQFPHEAEQKVMHLANSSMFFWPWFHHTIWYCSDLDSGTRRNQTPSIIRFDILDLALPRTCLCCTRARHLMTAKFEPFHDGKVENIFQVENDLTVTMRTRRMYINKISIPFYTAFLMRRGTMYIIEVGFQCIMQTEQRPPSSKKVLFWSQSAGWIESTLCGLPQD